MMNIVVLHRHGSLLVVAEHTASWTRQPKGAEVNQPVRPPVYFWAETKRTNWWKRKEPFALLRLTLYETLRGSHRRTADVFTICLVAKLAVAKMTDFITFHIWPLQTVVGFVSRNQSASEHKSWLFPPATTKVLNKPRRGTDSTMRQTWGHNERWISCQGSWMVFAWHALEH